MKRRTRRTASLAVRVAGVALLSVAARPALAGSFTITATLANSIPLDPRAAFIETVIYQAINFYETNITTPINVNIEFQEGSSSGVSGLTFTKYEYPTFTAALAARSSGDDTDTTAVSSLPTGSVGPFFNDPTVNVNTANARALGLAETVPTFDGVITLDTANSNPGSVGSSLEFSLLTEVESDIDVVLGLDSDLGRSGFFFTDPLPEDLFRYNSSGVRVFFTSPSCADAPAAFFSLNGTTDLAQFNNCTDGENYAAWQSNPFPNGVGPQVQDASLTVGASPSLNADSPELVALDAIGYDLIAQDTTASPEPSSICLVVSAAAIIATLKRRNPPRVAGK